MPNQNRPQVKVLLSTYNGAKYLSQQVQSILQQTGVDIQLFIRDDGSKDQTRELLTQLATAANVQVSFGANVGWKKSFTHLLEQAPLQPDAYYAFADQDDVWQPDKMSRAVSLLAKHADKPTVYHSNVAIVDGKMQFQQNRFSDQFKPNQHFPESFFDGLGVGATMVFNAAMLALVQEYTPKVATNHDALVMALGNMVGQVIYDPTAHILYRRHDGTATGFGAGTNAVKPTLMDRYRKYQRGPKQQFSIRAAALVAGYGKHLTSQQRALLTKVATYRSHFGLRLALLFSPKIVATGMRKTLQVKYRILMGTL